MDYNVGVNVVEGIGTSPIEGVSTAVSGILGNFERGLLNKATLVTTMSQFQSMFGTVPAPGSTSYYSVKAFFAKVGSAPLYVVRVASSTAAAAFHNFDDSAAADTIKIAAANEGIWGNVMSIQIAADNILSTVPTGDIAISAVTAVLASVEGLEVGSDVEFDNTTQQEYRRITAINAVTKTIHWVTGLTNGYTVAAPSTVKSQEFKALLYINGVLVETHTGLGVNSVTSFFLEKKLVSNYITGTFIKVTPDDDYQDLPAAIAATALTGGLDGLSDVLEADYSGVEASKTGVYAFDEVENLFRFCCPNPLLTDAEAPAAYLTLTQALTAYADTRITLMYYGDVAYSTTVSAAVTWGGNFTSRRLALFYPWIKVVESSITKWLPPSSFVLGAAVAKDSSRGVHKNVGNEVLAYALDLEYNVSASEGEVLNNAGINTIRKFSGRGIRNYGGRTRSSLTAWRFIHVSELWNYIARSVAVATQNVPFEPHDMLLWKSVIRRITAFLENERKNGALFDISNPTGVPYAVTMDATNNPPDQVAEGIANVRVEYVPVSTAEKFVVELTSSSTGLTINE
jgi:phage tail sheath protein FI